MSLIPAAVTNKFGRSLLHLQKSSPKVMFVAGVATAVTGTMLACRATLKVSDVLAETEEVKAKAESVYEGGLNPDYDEKTYNRDLMVLKVKTILNVTKLYAPSAGLMMLSVALLTGSHVTLTKRNASLTAAYAGIDQAFEKYRQRVIEGLGEDADREFRYGVEKVEEKVKGDDGKTKTITRVRAAKGEGPSMYAKFFAEHCKDWQRNPEYNRIFLRAQQNYANDLLKARGHVFLNEVYDSLGIERTSAGAVVGWVLSKDSDNFVDFGIFDDLTNPQVRDFVNGDECSILLDFNVDGVIYDKI